MLNHWVLDTFEQIRRSENAEELFRREYLNEYPLYNSNNLQPVREIKRHMNLRDTVKALEFNNIQVALDLGVHGKCDLDSNCPLAVDLRRLISSSNITLEQLLSGYASLQSTPSQPETFNFPEFDGKTSIQIAGQPIQIDLTDAIQGQLRERYAYKIMELDNLKSRVYLLGESLYRAYEEKVQRLSRTKSLPQLKFEIQDLIGVGCLITTDGDYYQFLFPFTYSPQYIVDNGVRFELSKEDKVAIKRNTYIFFQISRDYSIFKPILLKEDGDKFQHYHGNNGDCWGTLPLPRVWDGTLQQLSILVHHITGALATINSNSLMQREPPGMPLASDIMGRATRLGEEGHTEERVQPEGRWEVGTETPRTGWGRRR